MTPKTPLEILLEKAKSGELIPPPKFDFSKARTPKSPLTRFSFSDELSPGQLIGPRPRNASYEESFPPTTEAEFEASVQSLYKDLYTNPPLCDNQTGGVVEHVEPWFLDPVFQIVEIGPFGKPEHHTMDGMFLDTWEDNEGHIQIRETPVPDFNFVVTSGGLPIYFYARDGYWLGSELIRRKVS